MMGRTIGRGTEVNDPSARRRAAVIAKIVSDIGLTSRARVPLGTTITDTKFGLGVTTGRAHGASGSGLRVPALGRAMSFATSSEWDDGGAESSLPDDVVRRVLRHVHPAHLNTCAAVCRRWRRCVADLRGWSSSDADGTSRR